MTPDIIVLLIGIAASTTLVFSALSTHKQRLLSFSIATGILVALQYGIVGSHVALAVSLIGITRTVTVLLSHKWNWLNHWISIPIFLTLHTTVFAILNDWNHITLIGFIPLIGAWVGTIAIFFSNLIYTKSLYLFSSSLWFIYEFNFGMYGQMVGEALTFAANTAALTMLVIAARKNIPSEEIPDVDTQIINIITTSIPVIHQEIRNALTTSITIVPDTNTKEISIMKN
jgi:hypothetical protein